MATTSYGFDISTFVGSTPDLDPTFAIVSGPRVVLEAVARRWLTLNGGGLFYAPSYGFDTRLLINSQMDSSQFPGLSAQLEAEACKDERVRACTVAMSFNSTTGVLSIKGTVTLATGTFTLVLTIDQVNAQPTLVFPSL